MWYLSNEIIIFSALNCTWNWNTEAKHIRHYVIAWKPDKSYVIRINVNGSRWMYVECIRFVAVVRITCDSRFNVVQYFFISFDRYWSIAVLNGKVEDIRINRETSNRDYSWGLLYRQWSNDSIFRKKLIDIWNDKLERSVEKSRSWLAAYASIAR